MTSQENRYIRIAGIIEESIVDGPGFRFVVFTQGCKRHCKGCHNEETWDLDGGKIVEIDKILKMLDENPLLDGITLSGGEPFLQPDACCEIAKGARERGLEVMTYTGFTYEEISEGVDESEEVNEARRKLLQLTDILVDGPFVIEKKSLNLMFRGSSNQRLLYLKDGRIIKESKD
ncbi:MAG TPA: anaerobic ribonucleoside-triphosphate reductase activating protein [Clostridia bacterium]|jgi:anaerobic ribonucleoside-triphosphate reductase activating protein|nr:anaerobic ribonucleoside-triphosphate reductase activating protein [Clostridiaceae bacterium]HPZ52659.1 anaerobic ribonucleoside-triphosphate reductase activating protein [Clostridia bacterium]